MHGVVERRMGGGRSRLGRDQQPSRQRPVGRAVSLGRALVIVVKCSVMVVRVMGGREEDRAGRRPDQASMRMTTSSLCRAVVLLPILTVGWWIRDFRGFARRTEGRDAE
jgi:hypothetical protein